MACNELDCLQHIRRNISTLSIEQHTRLSLSLSLSLSPRTKPRILKRLLTNAARVDTYRIVS